MRFRESQTIGPARYDRWHSDIRLKLDWLVEEAGQTDGPAAAEFDLSDRSLGVIWPWIVRWWDSGCAEQDPDVLPYWAAWADDPAPIGTRWSRPKPGRVFVLGDAVAAYFGEAMRGMVSDLCWERCTVRGEVAENYPILRRPGIISLDPVAVTGVWSSLGSTVAGAVETTQNPDALVKLFGRWLVNLATPIPPGRPFAERIQDLIDVTVSRGDFILWVDEEIWGPWSLETMARFESESRTPYIPRRHLRRIEASSGSRV